MGYYIFFSNKLMSLFLIFVVYPYLYACSRLKLIYQSVPGTSFQVQKDIISASKRIVN